jgi:hypothetical protein
MPHPLETLKQMQSEMENVKEPAKETEKPKVEPQKGNGQTAPAAKAPAKSKEIKVAKKVTKTEEVPQKVPEERKNVQIAKRKGAKAAAAPAPAKRPVKAEKTATKVIKATKTVKATKATKNVESTEPKARKSPKQVDRTFDRDKKGDGLRPIERKIVKSIANVDEPMSVVAVARRLFGKDCPSEGENSVRVVRNGIRMLLKYNVLEATGRGTLKVSAAYKKADGDISKIVSKARKAKDE